MNDKTFADTNIIVYAYTDDEPDKRAIVLDTLDNCNLVISTQVIREFITVMVRKFKQAMSEVQEQVNSITEIAHVVYEDLTLIHKAIEINQKYKFRFYDCLIVAAALTANCKTLLSEDMQHGQIINETLTISNPFI